MCDIVDRIVRGAKRQGEELERIRVIQKKLDKGIDDIEAGRVYSVDEAFSIIEERLKI